jgi:CysZ protein
LVQAPAGSAIPSQGRTNALAGVLCLGQALRLLQGHRELWPLVAAPLLVSLLAFGIAAVLFWSTLDPFTTGLQTWLAVPAPTEWVAWVWVGPLRALAWLTRWVLVIAFAAAVYLTFTLVGGILASPFLDALSRRVERLRTGTVIEVEARGVAGTVRAALRIAWEEAKRILLFLSVQSVLFVLSFVPGLQIITVPAGLVFAALFLPLDYAGYVLDRRGLPFRSRVRWVWGNKRTVGLFGAAAMGSYGIPGLNFLALPWLVTAATLLVLRFGAPGRPSPL